MNTLTQNTLTQKYVTQERRTYPVEFNPLNYDLIYYLDADTAVDDGAGLISSWTDLSGNGYSPIATGTKRPTRITGFLNGHSVLRGNGTTNFMYKSFGRIYAQPSTRFIVWSNSVNALGVAIDGAVGSRHMIASPAGKVRIGAPTSLDYAKVTPFADFITTTAIFNATTSEIYENGVLKKTGRGGTESNLDLWVFSGSWGGVGGTAHLNGDIACIIAVEGLLPIADRVLFQNFLQARYGHY